MRAWCEFPRRRTCRRWSSPQPSPKRCGSTWRGRSRTARRSDQLALKIVLDASPLADARRYAGIGRYVERLGASLQHVDGIDVHLAVPRRPPRRETRASRYANGQRTLLSTALSVRPAVVHATSGEPALWWPLSRQVVTVHDVYPWATLTPQSDARLRSYLAWQRLRLRRCAAVIAVSADAAHKAHEVLGIDEARIHVVPEGASEVFTTATDDDVERIERVGAGAPGYALWVGSLRARDPRKGLDDLLAAVQSMGDKAPRLVMAGDRGPEAERIKRLAAHHRIELVMPGRVSDPDLAALYRGAGMVVMPSLDEGFGLPVLEAMACGAPVVATMAGNLPDLAGDAALLVPPQDPTELAGAMMKLGRDQRLLERLRRLGPKRAAEFSWDQAARRTAEVYMRVAGG